MSRSLNPGGRIVILEQMDEKVPTPASNTVSKLLALSYFHLLSGKIYSQAEITGWLKRAGFTSVQRINMLKLQGNALLLGTKGD